MNLRFISYYILRFFSRLFSGRNFLNRNKLAVNIYLFFVSIVQFFSIAHRKQKIWEKKNSDAPWLVPDSVIFLEKWLKKNMKGFEFGSGRSTKWFTNKISFYYSVEGNIEWYNKTINENKENIQKQRCEIIYKETGNQLEIDLAKKMPTLIHYQNFKIITLILVLLMVLLINLCCLIEYLPNSSISPNIKYFLEFFNFILS